MPFTLDDEALHELGRRAELAGLNASAPPQQAQIDGWLIRLSPGKAKRSRCINALATGSLPLPDLLAQCRRAFDAAGLPLILRITPFSQPADLDDRLAAMGWQAFDAADVMVRASLDDLSSAQALPQGMRFEARPAADYAEIVGHLRGSTRREIDAHIERLQQSPVPYQGFVLMRGPTLLACGQFAQEGDIVGLFDIFTPPEQRGQGRAGLLCIELLRAASAQGARQAYLQVGTDNAVAQRLYQRLGFVFSYRYHYRSDDPRAWD